MQVRLPLIGVMQFLLSHPEAILNKKKTKINLTNHFAKRMRNKLIENLKLKTTARILILSSDNS